MSDTARTTSSVRFAYGLTTYRREPAVQDALERWDQSGSRLGVPLREWEDPSTPLEALVAVVRALAKGGLESQSWAVVEILVRRVAPRTYRHLAVWGAAGGRDQEDLTRDIIHMMIECVLSTNPQNEFWECRFWTCFDRRVRSLLRDFSRRRLGDTSWDDAAEQLPDTRPGAVDWTDNVAASALLDRLPEPMRTAFYLKHYAGYKEESADGELTIASVLGVSGRSVRNYLKKAELLLSEWRAEEAGQ